VKNRTNETPTERQIDFATAIAEVCGDDLPDEYTKAAYSEWIDEHIDEFYMLRNQDRYESGNVFYLEHSYAFGEGFNGDRKLAFNPYSR